MATKKRKVDTDCHIFNEKWGEKYFFVEADNHTANCLICSESIAVWKEYNLWPHYEQSTNLNIQSFWISYALKNFSQWNGICRVKEVCTESLLKMNGSLVQVIKLCRKQ